MITLGGMIGPIMADDALTAAANAGSKPRSRMALISISPRPAASACATPDIAEKIMLATTLQWARPPRMWPTRACAKRKMRVAMPEVLSSWPARINNGTASSGKLSRPGAMRWTTMESGTTGLSTR